MSEPAAWVELDVLPLWRGKGLRFPWRSAESPPSPEIDFKACVQRREGMEWLTCGYVRADIVWDDVLNEWGAGLYRVYARYNNNTVPGTGVQRDLSDCAAEHPTKPLPAPETPRGRGRGRAAGAPSSALESPDPYLQVIGDLPDVHDRLRLVGELRTLEREREMQGNFFKASVEMLKSVAGQPAAAGGGNELLVAMLTSDRDFWRNEALKHQAELQRMTDALNQQRMELMLARMGVAPSPGMDLKALALKHGPAVLDVLKMFFPGLGVAGEVATTAGDAVTATATALA